MEFNRNQFFLAGLVLLFLGIQFRLIDNFTLNEKTTLFLAARMQSTPAPTAPLLGQPPVVGRKTMQPPQWVGYALLSVGSVLVLHSLAMPKPGGGG
jgi:hypothetical protein